MPEPFNGTDQNASRAAERDLSDAELNDLNVDEIERLLGDVSEALNNMRWILQAADHDEEIWGRLRDARIQIGEARGRLAGFK